MDNLNENLKKCGFCGMDIPADAGRCTYCGSLLEVKVDQNIFTNPQEEEPSVRDRETSTTVNDEEAAEYKVNQQDKPDDKTDDMEDDKTEDKPNFEVIPAPNTGNDYRQNNGIPTYGGSNRKPLSNGLKVFLTILFTVIPGIGQLAGIITAIVFMNADDDADRKSFGVALLVASIILFVLSCIGCFVLMLVFSVNQNSIFYGS